MKITGERATGLLTKVGGCCGGEEKMGEDGIELKGVSQPNEYETS